MVGKVDARATLIRLTWSPGCSTTATDYAVYAGQIGHWYEHTFVTCSTGGATTSLVRPPSVDTYYLVVPNNENVEGSYGTAFIGGSYGERPVGGATCAPAQETGCP
jgi:hypothetical protein